MSSIQSVTVIFKEKILLMNNLSLRYKSHFVSLNFIENKKIQILAISKAKLIFLVSRRLQRGILSIDSTVPTICILWHQMASF